MDADFVRLALLQHNYFPNHRTISPEVPPFFHTRRLTPVVARAIIQAGKPTQPYKGCDYTLYTLTRFNGGPRVCGIPHPYPYCVLVERIHSEWSRIEPQIQSRVSEIQARKHPDGRLFVMDYGDHRFKSQRYLDNQACAAFIARADIANFYPSLYTHSIPWAIVGIDSAKNNTANNLWYNALDRDIRFCRRAETNGVSIGPGTSSLAAEIVLTQIDRALQRRFKYQRFIDDYACYARTRSEAQEFLAFLEAELAKYSLYLNFRKTSITPLPSSEIPSWIDELRITTATVDPNNFFEIKLFINRALEVAERYPEGSVLKYALHALCDSAFTQKNGEYVLRRVLGLAQAHSHLVPCLRKVLKFGLDKAGRFRFQPELVAVLSAAVRARRSDAMCWVLQFCVDTQTPLNASLENAVLKTYDTMSIVMLDRAGSTRIRRAITRFVRKLVLPRPRSVWERHWVLIHYLLNERRLTLAEVPDPSLGVLRNQRVNLYG
jgi:hypothetical protein